MKTNGDSDCKTTDGVGTSSRLNSPRAIALSPDNSFALIADSSYLRKLVLTTMSITTPLTSSYSFLRGVAIFGSLAFFCSSNQVFRYNMSATGSSAVSTLAGSANYYGHADGVGESATFSYPTAIVISSNGDFALVTDSLWCTLRKIILSTRAVSR
jgi:DNA-binding beta-propeller fold protein YncE